MKKFGTPVGGAPGNEKENTGLDVVDVLAPVTVVPVEGLLEEVVVVVVLLLLCLLEL